MREVVHSGAKGCAARTSAMAFRFHEMGGPFPCRGERSQLHDQYAEQFLLRSVSAFI